VFFNYSKQTIIPYTLATKSGTLLQTTNSTHLPSNQALHCKPQPPQPTLHKSTITSRDIIITMSTTNNSTSLIFQILPSLQQELNALTADRDELLEDYDLLSEYQHNLTDDAEYRHHRSKVINAAGKMLREKNAEILRLKQRVDDCKRIVRLSLAASSRT
jgi:hypothetical protein